MIRDLLRRVAPCLVVSLGGTVAVVAAPAIDMAQAVSPRSGGGAIVQLAPPRIADYWMSVNRQPGGVLVFDGYVPDEATRAAFAKRAGADVSFLKLGSGAPASYRRAVDFGLVLLSHLSEGRFSLRGEEVSLSGIAASPAAHRRLGALLETGLPPGLGLGQVDYRLPEGARPVIAVEAPEPAPAPETTAAAPPPDGLALCRDRLAELSAHNAILFQSGAAVIAAGAAGELDAFAQALGLCPEAPVDIAGHTDSDGDAGRNLALSVARAEAVVAALIERGVAAERLYAIGYGESLPVADNATADGKRRNRRIVVTLRDEEG